MIWGVEAAIPDRLRDSIEGQSTAVRMEDWAKLFAGKSDGTNNPVLPDINTHFKYTIGSTVPPHWIPFIPLRTTTANQQIVLRRAAMPRFLGEFAPKRIRPPHKFYRTQLIIRGL